jgi:hypothetical protein
MLENEQRIERIIAEEKDGCPTSYLLDTFSPRRWRLSTICSIVSPAEQVFFLLCCSIRHTEQK